MLGFLQSSAVLAALEVRNEFVGIFWLSELPVIC